MLMSINQVAKELGLSGAHVRKMIKKGLWPSYSLGKKAIRLDLEEIRRLARLISESKKNE
jgi:excisionase family DNA binding protein